MDKWIEEILKNAGKYIKDHQTEIKVGAGATIATGLASSMFWSDHEQKAVTEAEKRGMVKASQMYEEKFHKLVNQIDELERKLSANTCKCARKNLLVWSLRATGRKKKQST